MIWHCMPSDPGSKVSLTSFLNFDRLPAELLYACGLGLLTDKLRAQLPRARGLNSCLNKFH